MWSIKDTDSSEPFGTATDPTAETQQFETDESLGAFRLLDHPRSTQITCDVVGQPTRSSLITGGTAAPYFTDDFSGDLSNWVEQVGSTGWSIVAGELVRASTTGAFGQCMIGYNTDSTSPDNFAKVDIVKTPWDIGTIAGVFLRSNGTVNPTGYAVTCNTNSVIISYLVNGVNLADQFIAALPMTTGDTLAASIEGSGTNITFNIWKNPPVGDKPTDWGTPDVTFNNPANKIEEGGFVGLAVWNSLLVPPALFDNFSGGDLTVAQTPPIANIEPLVRHSTAHLVEWLLLEKTNFNFEDICQLTFPPTVDTGFDNTSLVGYYSKSETSVSDAVLEILNSVGAYIRFSRPPCPIQIFKFEDPTDKTPDLYLEEDEIIQHGLTIAEIEQPYKSLTLGYKKNWTVQDASGLASMLAEDGFGYLDELNSYTNEFSTVSAVTGLSDIQYPLAEEAELIETTICSPTDAQNEVDRRAVLRGQKRFTFRVQSVATPFLHSIGDVVRVTFPRYGFETGRNGIIIGMEESPTKKRVNLDVWL